MDLGRRIVEETTRQGERDREAISAGESLKRERDEMDRASTGITLKEERDRGHTTGETRQGGNLNRGIAKEGARRTAAHLARCVVKEELREGERDRDVVSTG